jgi:uncharacterized membrane protein YjfL (UPF0719 family)
MTEQLLSNIVNSAAFALLGVVLFAVAFLVIDLLTPGKLWDELSAKQNSAVAIVIGCVAIALGIIVAAAIH